MRARLVWCLMVAMLALPQGAARALDDPDTEGARRHFGKGRQFYDAGDYRRALDEFQAAKRLRAAPGLDYNIARCFDRLEEYSQAIRHYELYVAADPRAADAAEVKARVVMLRQRLDEARRASVDTAKPAPEPSSGEEKLLPLPSFVEPPAPSTTAAPAAAVAATTTPPPKRHTGAIFAGVLAGAAVVAGAIALGIIFGSSSAPSYTPSSLGAMRATP
jgi:tetratricopeptide (TPR) repeat protein